MSDPLFKSGALDDTSPHDRLWPSSRGFPGEADEPMPFDLHQMIDVIAADLSRRKDGKDLTLRVRYALGAPRFLLGPGDRVRQVMRKLVDRAVTVASALYPRGHVVIDVQGDECTDGCAAMRLRVEVAGPGKLANPLDSAPRGDDPAKVKSSPVSTLADCRRLVELMGGRLGTLSDPDRGSFVWLAITLPIATSRPRGSRRSLASPAAGPS